MVDRIQRSLDELVGRGTRMTLAKVLAAIPLFALLAVASCEPAPANDEPADAALEVEGEPCPREPARAVFKGTVADVTNDPPCRLVFRPTGVRLNAVADGSRPDPGLLVVKDGRGRYYSTQADGWGPTISVWSADGSYLSSFGTTGDGPGEFASESLSLFVDAGDSLHVWDSYDWSVFSPEHEYMRQISSRVIGSGNRLRETETAVLLYDGRILAGDGHESNDNAYFRIVNRDGTLDDTFGTAEEGTGAGGHYGRDRAITYLAGHRSFWAAPSVQGSSEYALEEWDFLGDEGLSEGVRRPTIVQSLRRHQSWFKWAGDRNTSAFVGYLHITSGGLLYVLLWRPSEEYLEAMKPYEDRMTEGRGWTMERQEEVDALGASLTHMVMEVIDVGSAQLLASATYPVGELIRGNAVLPHGGWGSPAEAGPPRAGSASPSPPHANAQTRDPWAPRRSITLPGSPVWFQLANGVGQTGSERQDPVLDRRLVGVVEIREPIVVECAEVEAQVARQADLQPAAADQTEVVSRSVKVVAARRSGRNRPVLDHRGHGCVTGRFVGESRSRQQVDRKAVSVQGDGQPAKSGQLGVVGFDERLTGGVAVRELRVGAPLGIAAAQLDPEVPGQRKGSRDPQGNPGHGFGSRDGDIVAGQFRRREIRTAHHGQADLRGSG